MAPVQRTVINTYLSKVDQQWQREIQWAVLKVTEVTLMLRLPSVAPALRCNERASNFTAGTYGFAVEQVETKLSMKDFNKYLNKLHRLGLQFNRHLLTSTSAKCSNNGNGSMGSF